MKPLTISDFSFTIKKPSSTVVAEPTEKPKVNETKPPEPAIDTSKLTGEQAEKFKGLLSVDPENAKDITVEEYIALAESVMTFKEETIEGYNRYDNSLRKSQNQLRVKVEHFDPAFANENVLSAFAEFKNNAVLTEAESWHPITALSSAKRNENEAVKLLDTEYLSSLQSDLLTYLNDNEEQLVDEKA